MGGCASRHVVRALLYLGARVTFFGTAVPRLLEICSDIGRVEHMPDYALLGVNGLNHGFTPNIAI